MDIFNEKQALSTEEMDSIRGGGRWIKIGEKWHWIESKSINPSEEEKD